MMITENLVSVIIITYNSADYVLETLESAKNQTYKNIELIISDDCSKDNTVEICEDWLFINKERFRNSEIIKAEKNTGIPKNCNRGIKASKGIWIKEIAGDDALENDCIGENINFVNDHNDVKVIQSLSSAYKDTFKDENFLYHRPSKDQYSLFDLEAKQQHQHLNKKGNFVYAPSIMMRKDTVVENGLYDERFQLMEDYPMWLKLTNNNIKIDILRKTTVKYRIHSNSVMRGVLPYMSEKFAKSNIYFLKTYFAEKMDFKTRKEIFKFKLIVVLNKLGLNKKSLISKILFAITFKL